MAPIENSVDSNQTVKKKKSEWLCKDFFQDIVQKEFGEGSIKEFDVKSALSKGENYASVMDRVTLQVKTKDNQLHKITYLVKSGHETAMAEEMTSKMAVFGKETAMYTKIVPEFEKLFHEIGEDVTFGAKCLKATSQPDSIVLEDLSPKGFVNIPRHYGMDITHAKAVLRKLAQFHAASACLYEKQGPYPEQFNVGMFSSEMVTQMEGMFEMLWSSFDVGMKSWKGLEKYSKKIEKFVRRGFRLMLKAEEIDPNDFNVLNHGDLWSNNIMFQYDEDGIIKEVYLVDLQMSKWGSPVHDLQYFFVCSLNNEIRIKEFDNLVKYYFDNLIKNLEKLNYPKELPKLVDIQIQLLKRGYIGVNTSLMTLTAVLLDPSDHADMESFMADNEQSKDFRVSMYTTPRYIEALRKLLPFFDNRGLLDL